MRSWPQSVIATHSGLRGRPGVDLTPAVVRSAVEGMIALIRDRGSPLALGVARDDRPSGRTLAAQVIAYATEAGADAVDFGAISTPAAKLAARRRALGGVVIVTGSHLDPDWNGLKLVAAPGYVPLDLRSLPLPVEDQPGRRGRVSSERGAAREHAEAISRAVDVELIRGSGLTVAASGGVGGGAQLVLEQLGCRVGSGPADLGLQLDPDGDRLTLVDEHGVELDPEVVLPLVALARDARTVVKGADTSRMVDDLVATRGGSAQRVAPGELHLVEALAEAGGDLGGEGNGGVVIPHVGMARDALAAAAALLELCARTLRPISGLVADLPQYVRQRSTVACRGDEAARLALDRVAGRLGVPRASDVEEGVCVETGDGAWGLVRRSATEPVLRVTVEARTRTAVDALHAELRAALSGAGPAP